MTVQDAEAENALHTLLFPQTLADFLEGYWEREPLLLQRENHTFLQDLLALKYLDDYLASGKLSEDDLQIASYDGPVVTDRYLRRAKPGTCRYADPEAVLGLFAEGATLIFNGLDRVHPGLHRFCRSLEDHFGCRVQANVYLSPAGHQGFAPHFDAHDVFVLQICGDKRWNLFGKAFDLPQPGRRLDTNAFQTAEAAESYVLRSGDALYVPRGVVHEAIAMASTSCHVTVGFHTTTVAALLEQLLEDLVDEERSCRTSLPLSSVTQASAARLDLAALRTLLLRLPDEDRVRTCLERLRAQRLARRPMHLGGQLMAISDLAGLSLDSLLSARPGLDYSLERSSEHIRLSMPEKDIEFPAYVERSLLTALAPGTRCVRELEGELDNAGKLVLVRRLVREHVLTIVHKNDGHRVTVDTDEFS